MGFAVLANLFYVPNMFGIKSLIDKEIQVGVKKAYIATYGAFKDRYIQKALLNADSLFHQLYKNDKSFNKITRTIFVIDIIVTFSASADTTGTVFEAAILWIAKYPKLQKEICQELLQCSGQNTFDRFRSPLLSQPNFIGLKQDCIYELAFSSVMKCHVDHKKDVLNNNACSSNTTMLEGITGRLRMKKINH